MRTSFHRQPEAQHPIFQLSTSWQAITPSFGMKRTCSAAWLLLPRSQMTRTGHRRGNFAVTHNAAFSSHSPRGQAALHRPAPPATLAQRPTLN
jgi:hypothetical protein